MKKTKLKKRRTREDWTNEDWRKEAVEVAKKIAKHKAGYICTNYNCTNSAERGKQMHGSHILPEGTYHRMSVVVENIMCQCAYHHMQWHDHPLKQHEWFHEQFPGRLKKLEEMEQGYKSAFIKPDYKKILADLQEEYGSLIN